MPATLFDMTSEFWKINVVGIDKGQETDMFCIYCLFPVQNVFEVIKKIDLTR